MGQTIDLREGYRIEVEPMILPEGKFGARLYKPPVSDKGRWKQVGHVLIAESPEKASSDLLLALNQGLFPDVEVAG